MSDYEYLISEAGKLGLTCIDSPDERETVIFNLAAIERGCLLVTISGQIHGAGEDAWSAMGAQEALALMDLLAE